MKTKLTIYEGRLCIHDNHRWNKSALRRYLYQLMRKQNKTIFDEALITIYSRDYQSIK